MKRFSGILAVVFTLTFNSQPLMAAEAPPVIIDPGVDWEDIKVTISAEGIPLKDILKVMSEQTGFSYVAGEELENKRISLNLDNVPIREALTSIASANQLKLQKKTGSKVILFSSENTNGGLLALEVETRVFRLKYTRLSLSPLEVGGTATINDLAKQAALDDTGSSSGGSSVAPAAGGITANLTASRGVDRIVASLLTASGKITVDIHTNSMIVTDTPEKLDQIEQILKAIDQPTPQVLIEVFLMEVKKNVLIDHGIDWGGTSGALGTLTAGSRTTGFPFTESFFNQSGGVKATTQGTSAFTLGTLNAANFTATLRLLTSDVRTKILARPRLLTLNNEAANIKLVTNAAIANTTTLTTSEGQASSTSNVAERTQIGIVLKMTPQINEDNSIGLFIEPSITTVAASSFFPTIFLDPTTRTVRTMARVMNNQTLVIGGLLDRSDDMTHKKIPILGDIPFLGSAFSYKDGNNLDRELLIFITPHIVSGYDSFGPQSDPTAFSAKTPSIQRVLDDYREDEMRDQLEFLEAAQRRNLPITLQENKVRAAAAKRPAAEASREMARSLDLLSRKK